MKHALALALTLLAACELPPLALRFAITDEASQRCIGDTGNQTTSCSDITMLCDAVISIRIVPPNDPTVPYISVCRRLTGGQGKLCSIAGVDLPQPTVPVPEQVLEVQMAVFPATAVTDPDTGEIVCPHVEFGLNGFPVAVLPPCKEEDLLDCPKVPAVGGRTFYNPGDTETVVNLGCTYLEQLTDELTCEGIRRITVTASVNDFDDLVSPVDRTLADRLSVGVGEPTMSGDIHVLKPADSRELVRIMNTTVPAWGRELTDLTFQNTVCLEVLEDGAQSTTTLTCRTAPSPDDSSVDISGVYLKKNTLDDVLAALALIDFPDTGLVVGMVVDEFFNPLANKAVTPSCSGCTIKYLNDNRTGLNTTTSTSLSGIFVSENAPFGTTFAIPSAVPVSVLGGLVEGKVTIVVIQDKVPVGN